MLENMAASANGRQLILNEDVGGDARLGKVWSYNLLTRSLVEVAQHDPGALPGRWEAVYHPGRGVVRHDRRVELLGKGSYLITTQAHKDSKDPALVQGGQPMLLWVPFTNRPR